MPGRTTPPFRSQPLRCIHRADRLQKPTSQLCAPPPDEDGARICQVQKAVGMRPIKVWPIVAHCLDNWPNLAHPVERRIDNLRPLLLILNGLFYFDTVEVCSSSAPRRRRASRRMGYPLGGATDSSEEEHTSELQSLRHLVCRLLL